MACGCPNGGSLGLLLAALVTTIIVVSAKGSSRIHRVSHALLPSFGGTSPSCQDVAAVCLAPSYPAHAHDIAAAHTWRC